MNLIRLDPPIPVVTPKGKGLAYFLRDYGIDYDDLWTVAIGEGEFCGQFWTFLNSSVKIVDNQTIGREASNGTKTVSG